MDENDENIIEIRNSQIESQSSTETITITGIGNFKGTITKTFIIN